MTANDHEYRYYIAAGRELQAIIDWSRDRHEAAVMAEALTKDVGADNSVSKHAVVGFVFADSPPTDWECQGSVANPDGTNARYYAPTRRTKAGKDLRKRMDAIRIPDGRAFSAKLGYGGVWTNIQGPRFGVIIRYLSFEWVGDTAILVVPLPVGRPASEAGWTPADSAPIKVSEYFTMKEAVPS